MLVEKLILDLVLIDNPTNTSLVGASPGSLAAVAVLVLLMALIYPLGVLIARICYFRDKSETHDMSSVILHSVRHGVHY